MKWFIELARTGLTVFSYIDLARFFSHQSQQDLINKVNYYTQKGYLVRLRAGLYALPGGYDPLELANKLIKPSYISLQTALRIHGMVFQHEEAIYAISYKTTTLAVDGREFVFRSVKEGIRNNPQGIIQRPAYAIAWPERALLDTLYLVGEYHFDSLHPLDWEKAQNMALIYDSAVLLKRVSQLRVAYERENG